MFRTEFAPYFVLLGHDETLLPNDGLLARVALHAFPVTNEVVEQKLLRMLPVCEFEGVFQNHLARWTGGILSTGSHLGVHAKLILRDRQSFL